MAGGARGFIFFFLSRGARGGGKVWLCMFFFVFLTILIYLHNRLTRKNRSFYKLGGGGGRGGVAFIGRKANEMGRIIEQGRLQMIQNCF